jgi:hypothetical protein
VEETRGAVPSNEGIGAGLGRTLDGSEIFRLLEQSRAGCAVVIGATIAIGSCALAGCGEDALESSRIPRVNGAQPSEDHDEGPASVALEAEEGRIETLELSPGFTPDPVTRQGTLAGGPFDASEIDDACSGFIAGDPDFVLDAPRPFAELAVMVASEADTTLFIAGPEGELRCAADSDGSHPVVRALFEPGLHRVWVGSADRDAHARYTLALSELEEATPSALLH